MISKYYHLVNSETESMFALSNEVSMVNVTEEFKKSLDEKDIQQIAKRNIYEVEGFDEIRFMELNNILIPFEIVGNLVPTGFSVFQKIPIMTFCGEIFQLDTNSTTEQINYLKKLGFLDVQLMFVYDNSKTQKWMWVVLE